MSKLWSKDGSAVTIINPSLASGGGMSHHKIFEWAGDATSKSGEHMRSACHSSFLPTDLDAVARIPAAGKPQTKNFGNSESSTPEKGDCEVEVAVHCCVNADGQGSIHPAGMKSIVDRPASKHVSQPPGGKTSLQIV